MKLFIGVLFCVLSNAFAVTMDIEEIFLTTNTTPEIYDVAPKELLNMTMGDAFSIIPNNTYSSYDLRYQPFVTYPADPDKYYTLIFMCPDYPSASRPTLRSFLMMLIGNIPGNDVPKGKILTVYSTMAPSKNTGFLRGIMTLHEQPKFIQFTEVYNGDRKLGKRLNWDVKEFINKYNLSQAIRGNLLFGFNDNYANLVIREFMRSSREETLFYP